jgi:uncharacterized protein (UPF0248 family)
LGDFVKTPQEESARRRCPYNRAVTTVRELLNRLRWDAAAQRVGVVIEVRTREHGDERLAVIAFESVVDILPQGVTVAGETFLPYHRFVRVRRGPDVLWPPIEGTAR